MPLRGVEKRGEESGEVFFEVVARLLDREKGKEGSVCAPMKKCAANGCDAQKKSRFSLIASVGADGLRLELQ